MKSRIETVVLCLALAAAAVMPVAGAETNGAPGDGKTIWYAYDSGLGADGYDVVAYFEEKKARRGDENFSAEHGGQVWRFVSAKNRDAFVAAPDQFVPEYGGHCAYGVALGALPFGDPEVWTVHNGKLYFNFNPPTRARWLKNTDGYVQRAGGEWRARVAERSASGE